MTTTRMARTKRMKTRDRLILSKSQRTLEKLVNILHYTGRATKASIESSGSSSKRACFQRKWTCTEILQFIRQPLLEMSKYWSASSTGVSTSKKRMPVVTLQWILLLSPRQSNCYKKPSRLESAKSARLNSISKISRIIAVRVGSSIASIARRFSGFTKHGKAKNRRDSSADLWRSNKRSRPRRTT